MSTPLALEPLHRRAGARFTDAMGLSLPAAFGDPAAEERHVHGAAGLFDRSYRGVLDLEGRNVLETMNKVFSSPVTSLVPGRGQLSTILSAKGRILAGFQLFLLPSGALRMVLLEPLRESVTKAIQKYAFLSDISVLDRTREIGMVSLEGPAAARALASAAPGAQLPEAHLGAAQARVAGVGVVLVRSGESPEGGIDVWAPVSTLAQVWEKFAAAVREAGGGLCGHEAAEALRIEAGVARHGIDYDEENFPNDAGWDKALTYDKCYVGQEIVARMRTYGQANRRLAGLLFPPGSSPEAPLVLTAGGEEAGKVTSVRPSTRLGRPVGLAMVKRKHWEARAGEAVGPTGALACDIVDLPIVRLDAPTSS